MYSAENSLKYIELGKIQIRISTQIYMLKLLELRYIKNYRTYIINHTHKAV